MLTPKELSGTIEKICDEFSRYKTSNHLSYESLTNLLSSVGGSPYLDAKMVERLVKKRGLAQFNEKLHLLLCICELLQKPFGIDNALENAIKLEKIREIIEQ